MYIHFCMFKAKAIPRLLRFGAACKYNQRTIIPVQKKQKFYFEWIGHHRMYDRSIPVVCASYSLAIDVDLLQFSQEISAESFSTSNIQLPHQSDAISTKKKKRKIFFWTSTETLSSMPKVVPHRDEKQKKTSRSVLLKFKFT